jgi:hypothetical protein
LLGGVLSSATGGAGFADSIGSGRALLGGVLSSATGGTGLADSIGSGRAFCRGVLSRATGGTGLTHSIGSGRAYLGGVLSRATYSALFAFAARTVFTSLARWRFRCWLLLSKQRSPVSDLK